MILVIGQSSYDINVELEEEISSDKKYRIESTFECPGGPAYNAALLLGKWNEDVALVSRLGNDQYGQVMKKEALNNNVNLSYLINDDSDTPYSHIYTYKGKRTIFNFAMKLKKIDYECSIPDCRLILSDGHEGDITVKLFDKYPNAIKVMDGGSYRKERMKVAERVDYLIVSSQFAQGYTGRILSADTYEEIFNETSRINNKALVITLGHNGLLYKEEGKVKHMKAYLTDSIDSTGAGDIFHGAFVYSLSKNYSFVSALKFSSIAASISTEKYGSSSSIPDLKEFYKRYEEYENNK